MYTNPYMPASPYMTYQPQVQPVNQYSGFPTWLPVPQQQQNQMQAQQVQQQVLQPQQPQQQPQVSGIGGKIVDSVEVVRATDIPMDGNTYTFPKADGTAIYTKKWLDNGTTQVSEYRKVPDGGQETGQQEVHYATREDVETLSGKLDTVIEAVRKFTEDFK